jgi:hypothetical protein
MLERHARLAGALEVARAHPVAVDRARGASWVAERLAEPVPPDVLTVVWHSVTRLYWPREETEGLATAIDDARDRLPLAHVAMEHPWSADGALPGPDSAAEALMPTIELDGEVLGSCDHHGPPVVLSG